MPFAYCIEIIIASSLAIASPLFGYPFMNTLDDEIYKAVSSVGLIMSLHFVTVSWCLAIATASQPQSRQSFQLVLYISKIVRVGFLIAQLAAFKKLTV